MSGEWRELVRKCKSGDSKAQRALYDAFKGKLMGICRRYASSRTDAQDILQEVFVTAFLKIDKLNDAEKLSSWLTRLAINHSIDFYHRNKRLDFQDVTLIQAENGDYEALLANLADEQLLQLVNTLPDGCRLVFNLYLVEGYSHSEIAEMLNISVSTSRSQLNYARSLMKEKLRLAGITKVERYA
jgi:RNA polymerase sigma factor (sigma-70 family)